MLRKIKYWLIPLLLGIGSFSCENFLTSKPENCATLVNYFDNEKQVEAYVKGIHEMFRSAMGNVVILYRNRGLPFDVLGNTWTSVSNNDMSRDGITSPLFSWWREYDVIALTNQFIENIGRAGLSPERENVYLAQAYGIRAYLYFRLVQYFGDVPLCLESENVGEKAREPWRNVIHFVQNELKKTAEIAPPHSQLADANGTAITSKQYISCNTAHAINAYVYAWEAAWDDSREIWEKALSCALKVINSHEYELAGNPEEVCENVLLGNSPEGIFELDYRPISANDLKDYGSYIAGACQRYPIQNGTTTKTKRTPRISNDAYFDIFSEPEDLRIDAYAWQPEITRLWSSDITQGAVYIQKWRHPINSESGLNEGKILYYEDNEMLIRYADLILLTAEIYYNLGDYGNAVNYLNLIRERAGLPKYQGKNEELKKAIFKERERELFLEGHRFFDIVRNGYINELLHGGFKNLTPEDIENGGIFLPVGSDYATYNTLAVQTPYWASQFPFN